MKRIGIVIDPNVAGGTYSEKFLFENQEPRKILKVLSGLSQGNEYEFRYLLPEVASQLVPELIGHNLSFATAKTLKKEIPRRWIVDYAWQPSEEVTICPQLTFDLEKDLDNQVLSLESSLAISWKPSFIYAKMWGLYKGPFYNVLYDLLREDIKKEGYYVLIATSFNAEGLNIAPLSVFEWAALGADRLTKHITYDDLFTLRKILEEKSDAKNPISRKKDSSLLATLEKQYIDKKAEILERIRATGFIPMRIPPLKDSTLENHNL